jgi:hypothetical protein
MQLVITAGYAAQHLCLLLVCMHGWCYLISLPAAAAVVWEVIMAAHPWKGKMMGEPLIMWQAV